MKAQLGKLLHAFEPMSVSTSTVDTLLRREDPKAYESNSCILSWESVADGCSSLVLRAVQRAHIIT